MAESVPLVSVFMPVYNGERYLAEAIRSVLAQSLVDFELICVDDGSTDSSAAMLAEHARRDPRVVVLTVQHGGVVAAANTGLARCRGEFVARVDADDISEPNRLTTQVEFLQAHPECVAVGAQLLLIDEAGRPICVKNDTLYTHDAIDAAHLDYGWPIAQGATLFRRSALQVIGGYRPQYQWLEDLDLFLRLAEVGGLANLPNVLYRYRQHPASICAMHHEQQVPLREALYAETRRRRGLPQPAAPPPPHTYPSRRPADLHLLWAWWSLKAGNVDTARVHALRRLTLAPFSGASWRAVYCALRGR